MIRTLPFHFRKSGSLTCTLKCALLHRLKTTVSYSPNADDLHNSIKCDGSEIGGVQQEARGKVVSVLHATRGRGRGTQQEARGEKMDVIKAEYIAALEYCTSCS
jgi:hypothetical protein